MIETAYLFQAALIISWWIGISSNESFFKLFQYPSISQQMFSAFLIPDVVVLGMLSLSRAYYKSRGLQFIILGAFLYATLFCCNASLLTSGGIFPTAVMLLGLGYNLFLCFGERAFRTSRSTLLVNAMKTVVQIVCFWVFFLGVVPWLIQQTVGASLMPTSGVHAVLAFLLFVLCSSLGLWSSYTMVCVGRGTPLPLDQAHELITVGPYAVVRNPMAVAGLGQGVAVALLYLSWPIILYCLLGAVAWQLVVRPIEERDLLARFGARYAGYQRAVPCWIPRSLRKSN